MTAKVIASTRVIESLSGLTAITSLPSGDTDTAAAEIGRLGGTVEVGRTVDAVASEESVTMAVGSWTGVEVSNALAIGGPGWMCPLDEGCTAQAASSRSDSVSPIRAAFEVRSMMPILDIQRHSQQRCGMSLDSFMSEPFRPPACEAQLYSFAHFNLVWVVHIPIPTRHKPYSLR